MAPSPVKEATTFPYQSDGSGRDTYVIQNNGGYRPDYNIRLSGERLFLSSLRDNIKSPIRSMNNPEEDIAAFETYQNWHSVSSKNNSKRIAKIQEDVVNRLSKGSPLRKSTINYIIKSNNGTGAVQKLAINSFQGTREPYYSSQKLGKDARNRSKDNSMLVTSREFIEGQNVSPRSPPSNFMKSRRTSQSLLSYTQNLNKNSYRHDNLSLEQTAMNALLSKQLSPTYSQSKGETKMPSQTNLPRYESFMSRGANGRKNLNTSWFKTRNQKVDHLSARANNFST